jgi:hypothetical protein
MRAAAVLFAPALAVGAASLLVVEAAERPTLAAQCHMRANIPIRLAAASGPVEINAPQSSVALAAEPSIDPAELAALPAGAELFLMLRGLRTEAVGVVYALYIGGRNGVPSEAQYLDAFNFFDLTLPTLSLNATVKRDLVLAQLRGRTLPLVIVARRAGRDPAGSGLPRTTIEAIELVAQCTAG